MPNTWDSKMNSKWDNPCYLLFILIDNMPIKLVRQFPLGSTNAICAYGSLASQNPLVIEPISISTCLIHIFVIRCIAVWMCIGESLLSFIADISFHTSYLSREPRVYPCKFFLAGVNFYRFNAKNWHFRQILRKKVAFFLQI